MKNLLVISNGKGEDAIATAILGQLPASFVKANIQAWPLVGDGQAYIHAGIKLFTIHEDLPSAGFASQGTGALIKDLRAGLLRQAWKQWRLSKSIKADQVFAVGDIWPVVLGARSKLPLIHLASAYSIYLRRLLPLEKKLYQKCQYIFSRDEATAEYLNKQGLNAHFAGNPMLDDPVLKNDHPQLIMPKKDQFIIALVPSIRQDAYHNIADLLRICSLLPDRHKTHFLLSAAPSLDIKRIEKIVNIFTDKEQAPLAGRVVIYQGKLGAVLAPANLILGMTGTGNEQAVGLGKPLVLLKGQGAASSARRLKHYQRLLGEAVLIASGKDEEVALEINALLRDQKRREFMAHIGRLRVAGSDPQLWRGGARRIAEMIAS